MFNVGDLIRLSGSYLDSLRVPQGEKCRKWTGKIFSIDIVAGRTLAGVHWTHGTSCHVELSKIEKVEVKNGKDKTDSERAPSGKRSDKSGASNTKVSRTRKTTTPTKNRISDSTEGATQSTKSPISRDSKRAKRRAA